MIHGSAKKPQKTKRKLERRNFVGEDLTNSETFTKRSECVPTIGCVDSKFPGQVIHVLQPSDACPSTR